MSSARRGGTGVGGGRVWDDLYFHRLNLKKSSSKSIHFPNPDFTSSAPAQSQRCHGRAAVHAETTGPLRGERGTRRGRS